MSLWSTPLFANSIDGKDIENNLACWSLSVALAKKHFSSVELYTDEVGYKMLVEHLKLDFDNVKVVLDDALQYVNPRLWAAGKLVALTHAEPPFVHIDHDHFQLTPFELEFKDIIAFSPQVFPATHLYFDVVKYLKQFNFKTRPEEDADLADRIGFKAVNCGIIGFNHAEVRDIFITRAWDFINRIQSVPEYINYGGGVQMSEFSCLFEQWMLGLVIKLYTYDIKYQVESLNRADQKRAKVYHPWGPMKQTEEAQKFIRDLLIKHFPAYFLNFKKNIKE